MPTGDFENLLSQLMMASGLQTKVQADQKHAAVQQMLSAPAQAAEHQRNATAFGVLEASPPDFRQGIHNGIKAAQVPPDRNRDTMNALQAAPPAMQQGMLHGLHPSQYLPNGQHVNSVGPLAPVDRMALGADVSALQTLGPQAGAAYGNALDQGRMSVRHPLDLNIGPAEIQGPQASHMGPKGREPAGYKLSRKLYAQQHGQPDPYPDEPESMLRAQAQADVDQLMARKGGQQVGQDRQAAVPKRRSGVNPVSSDYRATGAAITNLSPVDNMPIVMGGRADEEANHAYRINDIAALRERGEDVPSWMFEGLQPNEIADAMRSGAEMDGYRRQGQEGIGRPYSPLEAPRHAKELPPGYIPLEDDNIRTAPYKGQTMAEQDAADEAGRQKKVMKTGRAFDKANQEGLLDAGAFDGMDHVQASRHISQMLNAERERLGDTTAWWREFAQDI